MFAIYLKDLKEKQRLISNELKRMKKTMVKPTTKVNTLLTSHNSTPIKEHTPLVRLLKRPQLTGSDIGEIDSEFGSLPPDVQRQVVIQCKYEGYLKRQEAEVRKFRNLESIKIPHNINYFTIPGLTTELRHKLTEIHREVLRPPNIVVHFPLSPSYIHNRRS